MIILWFTSIIFLAFQLHSFSSCFRLFQPQSHSHIPHQRDSVLEVFLRQSQVAASLI